MNENFLTSQKATNALSKMRSKACTLEELELTKEEIEELQQLAILTIMIQIKRII